MGLGNSAWALQAVEGLVRGRRLGCLLEKMSVGKQVHMGKKGHRKQFFGLPVIAIPAVVDTAEAHTAVDRPSSIEQSGRTVRSSERTVDAVADRLDRCLNPEEALETNSCLDPESMQTELLGVPSEGRQDSKLYMGFGLLSEEVTDNQAT